MTDHQKRVYNNIQELLSGPENPTPIVKLNQITKSFKGQIFGKLEWYNPFGAVKDRIAANLIQEAEASGDLGAVKNLVEPTSGNTGFALSMLANSKGYTLETPLSSMIPLEKRAILKFIGTKVVELEDTLCPAPGAPEGAIAKAMEKASEPGHHMLNQYANENNPGGHYKTTGPEVWKQTEGKVTHFVAATGTCGTITGTGSFLKEKNPHIKVIAVHPEEGHDIPGVRSLRQLQQTKLFKPELYDELVLVSNREAYDMCLRLNREESIIAGPSSGLALAGALKIVENDPSAKVVVMFPDNIFKYASSFQKHFPELYQDTIGSSANPNSKNKQEELLNNMIELSRNGLNTIDLQEAFQLQSTGEPLFVDVRSPEQYQAAHINGAISIPMKDLPESDQLPDNFQRPIITVCNRGNLSLSGMLVLKSMGYQNVKSLNGGTVGWLDEGLPKGQ